MALDKKVLGFAVTAEELMVLRARLKPDQTLSALIRSALKLPSAPPRGRPIGPVAKPYKPRKKERVMICPEPRCHAILKVSEYLKHMKQKHG